MNDNVELKQTGYGGFSLELVLSDKLMICTSFQELDNPKLYIRKRNTDTYHIIPVTPEAVFDLVETEKHPHHRGPFAC
jgi:hypothetical protein